MNDDAPTEKFSPPVEPPEPATRTPGVPRASNAPRIALIVIGSILAAAIAVLLLVLATRDDDPATATGASESAAPAPSETPPEEPAPVEPEPESGQGAAFTYFAPEDGTRIECPDEGSSVPLTFSWSSTGAQAAWIGVGTDDAKTDPYAEVEPTGTFDQLSYECAAESGTYTVTLDDGAGTVTHATVTLVRQSP
ncbi:MAG TPA: hypothetical protein VGO99_07025 [Leifsonia sp.]|jgi:hypothetical protein|nr:hypothetical protein [Leifsonia sp.]